ncbi:MAG: hypothetical protein LBD59_03090 [Prevotellaceae bacterium]|jgi:hypothetical protein|nr:hypothetical protein [Prevotellaceae bacterium]
MKFDLPCIALATTALIYLVVAFIQFRRVVLMNARVKHISKGTRTPAKILSYARPKSVEIEFVNHSNTKVIAGFRVSQKVKKLDVGSEVYVYMGDNPNNSPAIILEYDNKLHTSVPKYAVFGVILSLIGFLLIALLYIFASKDDIISSYIGVLIPVIAAVAVFIGVTEDEMGQNRINNLLLLYGINTSAQIRKLNSTGIVKSGFKQILFILEYTDKDGHHHFGKAEEPLNAENLKYFKKEKKVEILYSPKSRKGRCKLNYSWQR